MKHTPMPSRTVPLRSGQPLGRGSGLAARTGLKRHTRLKIRSEKQERKYEVRRPLVARLLAERPWCEIRWDAKCWRRATEVHEPGMRSRGADICDEAACVTGCHYCHGMVHDHPAEATRRGWLVPSGKKRRAA
jgi:hypothetical protein